MARSTRMLALSVLASASLLGAACDGPSGILTDLGLDSGDSADAPPAPIVVDNSGEGIADPEVVDRPGGGIADPGPDASGGGEVVNPREIPNRNDLGSPKPRPVGILVGEPASTLVRVQFVAQSGECTIHNASAAEFDDRVEITLLEGLHPNVAAMTCMNVNEDKEIVVTLNAPLGTRELIPAGPSAEQQAPATPVPDVPSAIDTSSYVGLPVVEATDRAQNAGIQWRVVRDGDEQFIVTLDYREDRINFEIDDGIVTLAKIG